MPRMTESRNNRVMQIDNSTVIFLGLGIVFMGLVCLIIIITVLGAIMKRADKKKAAAEPVAAAAAAAPAQTVIPNKSEFVAAVSVAVAEDCGTDVYRIRIHKIEKVG